MYMMECGDGSLYTGWTTDLAGREAAHNGRGPGGAKCTRARRPVKLVYFEEYQTKSEAMKREAAIKKLSREAKKGLMGR